MRHFTIISALALALAFVSCTKDPGPQTPELPEIRFAPQIQTKTYISDVKDAEFRKGFAVFASKTEHDNPSVKKEIMSNYKVWYDQGQWIYFPFPNQEKVWWGLNCDHHFLALYPWNDAATTYAFVPAENACHISKVSTIDCPDETTPVIGGNIGKDIMYARHQQFYKFGDTPAPIILQFKHCLSAISLKVRNASESDISNITGITLEGLKTKATNLVIERNSTKDPTMTLDEKSVGTYNFPNSEGSDATPWIGADDNGFKSLIVPSIILPQNFLNKEVWLRLKVKFKGTETLKSLDYKLSSIPLAGPVKDQYDYLPGKHYIYKIDILSNRINCSVEVKDWIDDPAIELK